MKRENSHMKHNAALRIVLTLIWGGLRTAEKCWVLITFFIKKMVAYLRKAIYKSLTRAAEWSWPPYYWGNYWPSHGSILQTFPLSSNCFLVFDHATFIVRLEYAGKKLKKQPTKGLSVQNYLYEQHWSQGNERNAKKNVKWSLISNLVNETVSTEFHAQTITRSMQLYICPGFSKGKSAVV